MDLVTDYVLQKKNYKLKNTIIETIQNETERKKFWKKTTNPSRAGTTQVTSDQTATQWDPPKGRGAYIKTSNK